jgi:hypothetical protein
MNLQDVNKKISSLSTSVKWGAGLFLALFLGPFLYLIGTALFGIAYAGAALIVASVVALAALNLVPAVAFKFANWKLRALKAEAAKNPVETLQNQQIALEKGLMAEARAITAFDTEVENFRSSLQHELESGYPEAASSGLPTLHNMERLLQYRRLKFSKAQAKLVERGRAVKMAESKFRVALAAQRVTAASGEENRTVLDKILEDIAFASVETAVNTSIAELRTSLMVEAIPVDDSDSPLPVEYKPSAVLDTNSLRKALNQPAYLEVDSKGLVK